MRAVILKGGKICIEEIPVPAPGEKEALIRIVKAGICNTDLELLEGYMDFQGVLGHEFIGQVVESSEKAWVGKRVVGEINLSCGRCATCLEGDPKHCPSRTVLGIHRKNGVFAEYATLPLENLHALPGRVSDIEGVFIEPLAAAVTVLDQISIDPQDDVLVLGDGKLGLLVSQVVRFHSPNVFCVGRHPRKLALLQKKGIQTARNIHSFSRKFDVVIEATGVPEGIEDALCRIKPTGAIVAKSTFQGLAKIDYSALVVNEIRLIGSRCGSFAKALEFLEREPIRLEEMVDAEFPLEDARKAFDRAKDPETIKVLLSP